MTDQTITRLRIALAQMNPIVGDVFGNIAKIRDGRRQAADLGADLVLFPELFVTGYPPEDLALKPAFAQAVRTAVEQLAAEIDGSGPAVLIGTIWPDAGALYNAVVLLQDGTVKAVRYKSDLPNYGVFDEKRIFTAGPLPSPIDFCGVRLGVPICEDIWHEEVCECLAECGAELFLVPNGSPFHRTKHNLRMNVAVARVRENKLPMAYVNQVGGQDELVFDGASFVLNHDASLAVQLPAWQEDIVLTEWQRNKDGWACKQGMRALMPVDEAAVYHACMVGLRDYVDKNGFPSVVLGLSGGIDSALVAALAVDALGKDRVHCIMLPYRYTSQESLSDAAACADALGVRYDSIAISEPVDGLQFALEDIFKGETAGVAEENIQSRTRGTLLMAISNKFGGMVVTTGNKSEMAVGYATLYGDMNGGYNPIKDLYKTEVYRVAAWRNANVPAGGQGPPGFVIPENILTKAPTAELRENQTDQDSLPPYDVLDDILDCMVEKEMPLKDIVTKGYDGETVTRVARLLTIAEYKRRQAAPGVRISQRNFGRDRRYPITNRFAENVES